MRLKEIFMLGLALCCENSFCCESSNLFSPLEREFLKNACEEGITNGVNSVFSAIDLDRSRALRNNGEDSRQALLNDLIIFVTNRLEWRRRTDYKVKDLGFLEMDITRALANEIIELFTSTDPEDISFRHPLSSILGSKEECINKLKHVVDIVDKRGSGASRVSCLNLAQRKEAYLKKSYFDEMMYNKDGNIKSLFVAYLSACRNSRRPLKMRDKDGLADALAYVQLGSLLVVSPNDKKTSVHWYDCDILHRSQNGFSKKKIYLSFSKRYNCYFRLQ